MLPCLILLIVNVLKAILDGELYDALGIATSLLLLSDKVIAEAHTLGQPPSLTVLARHGEGFPSRCLAIGKYTHVVSFHGALDSILGDW